MSSGASGSRVTGGTRASSTVIGRRATADLLIDSARLSDLLGRPVRATRLRYKPGLSTTAALIDLTGQQPPGWVQVTHAGHLDKLRNALRRAGDHGQHVHVYHVPATGAHDSLHLAHGEIDSDPRLQRGLNDARLSLHESLSEGRVRLLRYNPQRRIVLHQLTRGDQDLILRVTRDKQRGVHRSLCMLAAAGVPLLQPVRAPGLEGTRRVTAWPWFGTGNLQETAVGYAWATQAAAVQAGAALAAVHASDLRMDPAAHPDEELMTLTDDLIELNSSAGVHMRELAARVLQRIAERTWQVGTLHGDFSADQVLVHAAGAKSTSPPDQLQIAIALIDFDRLGTGALARDLGSFAAAELLTAPSHAAQDPAALPLTEALLDGYKGARRSRGTGTGTGTASVTGADLRTWVAYALLLRVLEPFRVAEPAWPDLIHQRLRQIEEVLR